MVPIVDAIGTSHQGVLTNPGIMGSNVPDNRSLRSRIMRHEDTRSPTNEGAMQFIPRGPRNSEEYGPVEALTQESNNVNDDRDTPAPATMPLQLRLSGSAAFPGTRPVPKRVFQLIFLFLAL